MSKKINKIKRLSKNVELLPTPERARQEGGLVAEIISASNEISPFKRRHRAQFSSVLDAYLWHGILTEREYDVGLKFAREYTRSVLKIKVDDYGSGSHGDREMGMLSAVNGNILLRAAFNALLPKYIEVIISVCVENFRAGGSRRLKLLCKALQILDDVWR